MRVWDTSGMVISASIRAAAALKAETPGMVRCGMPMRSQMRRCSAVAP